MSGSGTLAFLPHPGEQRAMLQIAIWTAAGYGVLALVGGVMGFVKAKSRASLIAGGVSGLVLIGASALALTQPVAGLVVAAVVSAALIARFAKGLSKGAKPVAIVMVGGGVAVLVTAALALV